MKMTSPSILTPQQWTALDFLKARVFGGRKRGTLAGSLVSDMAALEKAILLCGDCQGKFDWKRNQYYSVFRYEHVPAIGQCNLCSVYIRGNEGRLYIHESQRPKCWATPDEQRAQGQTMRRVAATHGPQRR